MKDSRSTRAQMKKETLTAGNQQSEKFDQALTELTQKMLKEGMSPQEAMGLDQQMLESIYAQAYRLYNTGKYIEATHLFRILIMMNAMEPKYTLGLAACFHMLKEYENAIQTYTMCSAIDPENPIPHYHSADCYIQMKDELSALLTLELAIKRAGDKPEYAKMKERALMSIESLKKQVIAESDQETST